MSRFRWSLLFLAGLNSGWIYAQSMPSEPILKRAPAHAEWSVQFFPSESDIKKTFAKNGGQFKEGEIPKGALVGPKSKTVSKDGTTYRELEQWEDGRSQEKWTVGDMQVYETSLTKKLVRLPRPASAQVASNYSDYRRSDFEELEWIGRDNFVGVQDMNGRKVYEFQGNAAKRRLTLREQGDLVDVDAGKSAEELAKEFRAGSSGKPSYVVYLDAQTQLPLYFDDGRVIRIYNFSANPPASLQVPQRFSDKFEAWKKEPPLPRFASP